MSKKFTKFRNKALRGGLIKSILLGLSLGMISGGAALLLSKFELISLPTSAALPIGIGIFILVGGISFLLHRVSDKTVAKRLDKRFGLNEKVQTMLAYKNEEGTIFELQREDAEASLAAVPARKFRTKHLWIYILIFLIGAASLGAAVMLNPVEEPPPVVPDVPFEITEMQLKTLEQLVEYVESSQMQSPHKDNVADALRTLLGELKDVKTIRERDESLARAMEAIYQYTDESSTAVELINALGVSSSNDVKAFAISLIYYDWFLGNEWDEFYSDMETVREGFRHEAEGSEDADAERILSDTKTKLSTAGSEILAALERSGVSSEDELYQAIMKYAAMEEADENGVTVCGFSKIVEKAGDRDYNGIQEDIDTLIGALNIGTFAVLEQHSANTTTGEYVMTRLSDLFDYPAPTFKRPDPIRINTNNGEGGNTDDNVSDIGGIGGGTVYGSDDLILDYNNDKYVEYGTLIDDYYKQMFGKLQDGDFSEEDKEAMQKYFDILYGGFEDEE